MDNHLSFTISSSFLPDLTIEYYESILVRKNIMGSVNDVRFIVG